MIIKLGQGFIDKATKEDDGFPGYNGPIDDMPLPTEADLREIWKTLYIARFVDVGFDAEWGEKDYEAGLADHDYKQDPVQAADDSLSYYCDDGDLA